MELHDSVECILRHKGSQVYAIAPDATVYEALEKLAEKDLGALVVMQDTELVGILSERDYARKAFFMGRSSRGTLVSETISSPPITVGLKTTIASGINRIPTNRARHLP